MPGVYKLPRDSRIHDLLVVSGGLSDLADREWAAVNLNLAAKLSDGQKIHSAIHSSRLEVIDGASHFVHQEKPQEVARLIRECI